MKVLKGSLVVFREIKANNLYLLQGFILGISSNASVVQSLDNAMLWHKRLGHVSEKSLSELVKQGMLG